MHVPVREIIESYFNSNNERSCQFTIQQRVNARTIEITRTHVIRERRKC